MLLKQLVEARYASNEIFAYVLDGEPGEEFAEIIKISPEHHYAEWVKEQDPMTWKRADKWVRSAIGDSDEEQPTRLWNKFQSHLESTSEFVRGYGDEKLVIVVGLK